MAKYQFLLVLLFLACSIDHSNGSHRYCVTSPASNISCSGVACNETISLSQINEASKKHSDVELYLCSDYDISTEGPMHFADFTSITIRGNANRSHFKCYNKLYGICFMNVSKIEVQNLVFDHCGLAVVEGGYNASMYISISRDILVKNVSFESGFGIGLALVHSSGYIDITNCKFDNNHDLKFLNPGGGIFIDSSASENATYNIERCNFTNNGASNESEDKTHIRDGDFVRGGGMNVYFRAATNNINVTIANCLFANNTAIHAGALCLSFRHSAHNVDVLVSHSEFDNNTAIQNGGAVSAGYVHETSKMTQNMIKFLSCNFTRNDGLNGGGVYVYSAPNGETQSLHNAIEFHHCTWKQNKGMYGTALLISPYTTAKFIKKSFLPTPLIRDSHFIDHRKSRVPTINTSRVKFGRGTIFVNSFHFVFQGQVEVSKNHNSALYLYSSILEVKSNSKVLFTNNSGYEGGAIHLEGCASIHVNDDSSLIFESNSAFSKGGAIFHKALVDRSQLTATNCFLKYTGTRQVSERNITLEFSNNTILDEEKVEMGRSIYLFSAIPCRDIHLGIKNCTGEKIVNTIATFNFTSGSQHGAIATNPTDILITGNLPKSIIPGRATLLNITAVDDLKHPFPRPVYVITKSRLSRNVTIETAYTTNSKFKVRGTPGTSCEVFVRLLETEDMCVSFNVTLEQCPPGYVHDKRTSRCRCSVDKSNTLYLGIKRCESAAHQATLVQGYWAGYLHNQAMEENFRTSHCPHGYCKSYEQLYNRVEILLPARASLTELNEIICVENRTGIVCGECTSGTSVYVHTQEKFSCGPDAHCHLGFLWLFLSEILPVTFLFVVVILFNIQLTTGMLNGFLLYMQMLSTLHITANNFIILPKYTHQLLVILHLIAYMFKLEFFNLPQLSFCLFKGGNTLHVLLINYLTVTYSLFLIVVMILLLNLRCRKFNKFCHKFQSKYSVIHTFSGFLVLCYCRTTLATLSILKTGRLFDKGYGGGEQVVFYQGNIPFFGPEHKKFAIPALFALFFMTCLPPLLLLSYPLCYKVFALLKLEESKFTKLLCKALPLERFKPLFDSFQGEFKDDHRFFAGLYFIYRLLALVLFVFAKTLSSFYFWLELLLMVMLALHGWFQPYKKKWHNRLDTYIFAILLIINAITQHNYKESLVIYKYGDYTSIFATIQVLLAYSPLVFMVIYSFRRVKIIGFAKYLCGKLKKSNQERSDAIEFSISMMHQRKLDQDTCSYHQFD